MAILTEGFVVNLPNFFTTKFSLKKQPILC